MSKKCIPTKAPTHLSADELSMFNKILQSCCACCGNQPDAVGSFIPDHPEWFGLKDREKALYFPICAQCLDGFDTEQIELQAMSYFGFFMLGQK